MKNKHGMRRHHLYGVWQNMKNRCLNKNVQAYKDYGGRGIKVCDRWKNSFVTFYEDMGENPEGYELERINNDGNYELLNCKWASKSEQCRNRRAQGALGIYGVLKKGKKFEVAIYINKKRKQLGIYETIELAAEAYDCAAYMYLKDRRFRNRKIMEENNKRTTILKTQGIQQQ